MKLVEIINKFGNTKQIKTLNEVLIYTDEHHFNDFKDTIKNIIQYCNTSDGFNHLISNYNRVVRERMGFDYTLFYCLASSSLDVVIHSDEMITCIWNGKGYDDSNFNDLDEYRNKLRLDNIYKQN